MKTYILFCSAIVALMACTQVNSTGEKTITQGDDTISEVDISLSKVDALNSLAEMDETPTSSIIFKASGTEPGWFAEFYQHKIRAVLDYGKDSLILNDMAKTINEKEEYEYDIEDDKDKSQNISIHVVNKPCVDAGSGNKMDRQVSITYKGKTYKGCGSFVK